MPVLWEGGACDGKMVILMKKEERSATIFSDWRELGRVWGGEVGKCSYGAGWYIPTEKRTWRAAQKHGIDSSGWGGFFCRGFFRRVKGDGAKGERVGTCIAEAALFDQSSHGLA